MRWSSDAPAIALAELLIDLRERIANRLHQLVERLLALADLADRVFLDVAELLIGQLQELVGGGAQRRARQRVERRLELRLASSSSASFSGTMRC